MPDHWYEKPRVVISEDGNYSLVWRKAGQRCKRALSWWEQIVYRATGKTPTP